MRKYSARSLSNLQGIHPDLRRVIDRALRDSPLDFVVIEGLRTQARQRELVASGASRTMDSRHLTGHAVDLMPIGPDGKGSFDWALYDVLGPAVEAAAKAEGVPIVWGGRWRNFRDGPHFELDRAAYPAGENIFRDDFQSSALPASSAPPVPVLMVGSSGEAVRALQSRLAELRYFSGKVDGKFGPRTHGAVMEFQIDNGLTPDGKVGRQTRAALAVAVPRALRDVTMADLSASRTVAEAEKGKTVAAIGGTATSVSVAVAQAQEVMAVVQEAQGVFSLVSGLAPSVMIVCVAVAVAWLAYRHFNRIEEIRLDDARTGANDRI
jgi:peptidoglycan L-alanyl-D-glutamate endopeptidase CwlK